MSAIRSIINFFLFGNIFIALCAVSLTGGTILLTGQPISASPLHLFIFFSTIVVYSLNRFLLFTRTVSEPVSERATWTLENKKIFFTVFFVSVIGTAITSFKINTNALLLLMGCGMIAIPYSIPFPFRKPLRNIPYLKIFLIAFTWSMVTSLLPLLWQNQELLTAENTKLFASRFLLISALTLPFDIRDMERDRNSGLKTIPAAIGIESTKLLALVCLALSSAIEWVTVSSLQAAALSVSSAGAGLLIFFTSVKQKEYYYLVLLDGVMIVRFLFLILVSVI